jgi:DNA mismatch endonuclease (patch repair protein)
VKSTARPAAPDATSQRQRFKRAEGRLAGTSLLTTTRAISARMGTVRQSGTFPELATRRIVYALGLRYTLNNRDLPGSPDLANRSRRFVIFVHGCFWHRHAGCVGASTPKSNRAFWRRKFAYNVQRDQRTAAALRKIGYRVFVIWECEAADRNAVARKLVSIRS